MDRNRVGRCVAMRDEHRGYFEIGFSRLKENAVELEFREQFVWLPPEVKVSVDFWADEAVEAHWLDNVGQCPCRD